MTPEFKQNVKIQTIISMIQNIDKIVEKEHVKNESELIDDGFNFATTLELEGYWLLPDGQFDFGDTSSNGTPLDNVSPLMDKTTFETNLLKNLNEILSELRQG